MFSKSLLANLSEKNIKNSYEKFIDIFKRNQKLKKIRLFHFKIEEYLKKLFINKYFSNKLLIIVVEINSKCSICNFFLIL